MVAFNGTVIPVLLFERLITTWLVDGGGGGDGIDIDCQFAILLGFSGLLRRFRLDGLLALWSLF